MWRHLIIQIIGYFVMFLLGCFQGWKLGKKRRPSAKKIATFTNEELSLLDDALLNEIERRTKEAMKQRRACCEGLRIQKGEQKSDLSRNGETESQDATERCPFEEFGGDKTCK